MDQDASWYGDRHRPTRHCVRWESSYPSPKGAHPQFGANVPCGQTAGLTKMPLGIWMYNLDPGDFVFDGTQLPPRKRRTRPPHPIFGPGLLWPKGWMDQDANWYKGKRRLRRHCVRWDRSSPLKGVHPSVFGSCLLWPNGWVDEGAT